MTTHGKTILEVTSRRPGRPTTRSADAAGCSTLLAGIELLKIVARLPRPANLSEIARNANLTASRAHRYLSTLVQTGMLRHDPISGYYSLGTSAVELGAAAMAKTDAMQIATDVMRELTSQTALVTVLCVWGTNGPTVVRWEQGSLEAAIRVREGINLSLVTTAAGQIFLAYLEPHITAAQLERDVQEWNRSAPPHKRITPTKLNTIRQQVRRCGFACAAGMRNPMVAALAAPVFDRNGLVMSLTLTGIAGAFDTNPTSEPAKCLRNASQKISKLLGADPSSILARTSARNE